MMRTVPWPKKQWYQLDSHKSKYSVLEHGHNFLFVLHHCLQYYFTLFSFFVLSFSQLILFFPYFLTVFLPFCHSFSSPSPFFSSHSEHFSLTCQVSTEECSSCESKSTSSCERHCKLKRSRILTESRASTLSIASSKTLESGFDPRPKDCNGEYKKQFQ